MKSKITTADCVNALLEYTRKYGIAFSWKRKSKKTVNGIIIREFEYCCDKAIVHEQDGKIDVIEVLLYSLVDGKLHSIHDRPLVSNTPIISTMNARETVVNECALRGHMKPINTDVFKCSDFTLYIHWGRIDYTDRRNSGLYGMIAIREYASKSEVVVFSLLNINEEIVHNFL